VIAESLTPKDLPELEQLQAELETENGGRGPALKDVETLRKK